MAINQFYRPKEINKALPFERLPFNQLFEAAKYAREKQDQMEAGLEKLNELKLAKHGLRTKDVAAEYNNMVQAEVDALRAKMDAGNLSRRDISAAASRIATNELRSVVEFDLGLTETYMKQRATEGFDKGYQDYFDNQSGQYIQLDPNNASVEQLAKDSRFIAPQPWQPLYMKQGRSTFVDQYIQNTEGAEGIFDDDNNLIGAKDPFGQEVRFTEEDVRKGFSEGLGEQLFQSNLQGMEFRARQYEETTGKPYDQKAFEEDMAKSMRGLYYTKEQGGTKTTGSKGSTSTEEGETQAKSMWSTTQYGVKQKEGNYALHEVLNFTKEYKENEEVLQAGGGAVGRIQGQALQNIQKQGLLPQEQAAVATMVRNGDLSVAYDSKTKQIQLSEINLPQLAEQMYSTDGITDKTKLAQIEGQQLKFMEKMQTVLTSTRNAVTIQNAELDRQNAKFRSMSRHRNELVRLTGADNFDDAAKRVESRLTSGEKNDFIQSYNTNLNTREFVNNREKLGVDEDKFKEYNKEMTSYITSKNPEDFWNKYEDELPEEYVNKMKDHYGDDYINQVPPTAVMEYVAVKKAGADENMANQMFDELSLASSNTAAEKAYKDNLLVQEYNTFVKQLEDVQLMSNRSYMLEPLNAKSLGVEQKGARAAFSNLIERAIAEDPANLLAYSMSDNELEEDDIKMLNDKIKEFKEEGKNYFDEIPVSVRWDQGQNNFVLEFSMAGESSGKLNANTVVEVRLGPESNIQQHLATFGVNSELIKNTYQGVNTLLHNNYNEWGTVEIGDSEYSLKKHESTTTDKQGITHNAGEYEIEVGGQRISTDNIEEVYAFHNNMYLQEDIENLSMAEAAQLVYSMGGSDVKAVMDNSGNPFIGNDLYIIPEENGEFNLSNSPGQGRQKATMEHVKTYMLNNTLADIGFDANQREIVRRRMNKPSIDGGSASAAYTNQGNTPTQTQIQTGSMSATYVGNGMTKSQLDSQAEVVSSGSTTLKDYMNVADKLGSQAAIKFKEAVTDKGGKIKVYKLGAKGTGNVTGNTQTTESEIDCSGAVCTVKNNEGFNYNLNMTNASRFYTEYADTRGIALDQAKDGDLIVMNTTGKGIDHIGMVVIDGEGNKYIAEATGAFDKSVIVPFDDRVNMLGLSIDPDASDKVVAPKTYEIIRDSKS